MLSVVQVLRGLLCVFKAVCCLGFTGVVCYLYAVCCPGDTGPLVCVLCGLLSWFYVVYCVCSMRSCVQVLQVLLCVFYAVLCPGSTGHLCVCSMLFVV